MVNEAYTMIVNIAMYGVLVPVAAYSEISWMYHKRNE